MPHQVLIRTKHHNMYSTQTGFLSALVTPAISRKSTWERTSSFKPSLVGTVCMVITVAVNEV